MSATRSLPAAAQETKEPDTAKARVRFGPLAMNPTIELTNLGVDTNVFNEVEGQEKSDFTLTLTPKVDLWLKVGRTWVTSTIREDLVWYDKYSSQRAANENILLGWVVPLNRLAFGFDTTYVDSFDRPGYEIDERVHHTDTSVRGAVEYRFLAKTSLGFKASRAQYDYKDASTAISIDYSRQLNRTSTIGSLYVKNQLTPLTAITIDAGRTEDRFEFQQLRDSDSTTAGIGVSFDPVALIKGAARFGYRDFKPILTSLPGYKGSTWSGDLSYIFQGSTKFAVNFARDVQFSYDINQPYYLQTGVTGSISQQIYGPLDVVVRGGYQKLAYQDRTGVVVIVSDRVDTVQTYGGGLGYHFGRDLRLGFNVDHYRRVTEIDSRRYQGLRYGVAVTYGS